MFTASRLQVATYLLAVCPFSIAFLVFLNSSVSFVVTDLIHLDHGEGSAVGNLGFADELLALVACPVWGLLSDRVGVRTVATSGFAIIGVALFVFVQAKNVYPQLLLARLLFSLGGAAASTMVTAILPSMTAEPDDLCYIYKTQAQTGSCHVITPSLSSELTITPARFNSSSPTHSSDTNKPSRGSSSRLAGFVGMLTGCGALVALGIFLPLPAHFQHAGLTPEHALQDSYYVTGAIALIISILCFIGLRQLNGEERKNLKQVSRFQHLSRSSGDASDSESLPYWRQFLTSFLLGFRHVNIGLGYVGGFVARASSVGISLFIPLAVNAYFKSTGLCEGELNGGLGDAKRRCPQAYLLAAELTGISQLIALLSAPAFGYVSDRYKRYHIPLILSAAAGIIGSILFASLPSPRPNGNHGSPMVFLAMALLGISQIGAIVCSLGLLSNGVLGSGSGLTDSISSCLPAHASEDTEVTLPDGGTTVTLGPNSLAQETSPLLRPSEPTPTVIRPVMPHLPFRQSHTHLKGSIAGMYSLYGGAGILLLTKLGGYLFDEVSTGAPFYMLATFNGVLMAVAVGCGVLGGRIESAKG